MYFKGERCCAEGIFQCETRSSYHHISHDVFVKGKFVRGTCLGCNWFYEKVFMDVYVFMCVGARLYVFMIQNRWLAIRQHGPSH